MSLARDVSLAAVAAGFVTVLVGFTSSARLVFQAARAFGATPDEIGSWILALGVGMGATCIALSLRYRVPVVTACSTPGAAMLHHRGGGRFDARGDRRVSRVCAADNDRRLLRPVRTPAARIPLSIAAAMLAGVLLRFGIDVFTALE
jgi:benzoate membrane transport protein